MDVKTMETVVVELNKDFKDISLTNKRIKLRLMSEEDWINTHASGTLRKNKNIGMSYKSQYFEERIAYEFGWEFESQPISRVLWGVAFTEGDSSSVTEAGWHIERYINTNFFPEDKIECKYINVEYANGEKKEGIGMIVRETSASWIPKGNMVFCIVAEFDATKQEWKHANNPF